MRTAYGFSILLLALIGLLDTIYLTYIKLLAIPVCMGNGCQAVLSSDYSSLFNIPISVFGGIGYLTLFIFTLCFCCRNGSRIYSVAIFGLSFIGMIVSLILMLILVFELHEWCLFCIISASVMSLIFILSLCYQRSLFCLFSLKRSDYASILKLLAINSVSILALYFGMAYYNGSQLASVQSTHVVGQVAGKNITLGELDGKLGLQVTELKRTIYEQRIGKLNELLLEHDAQEQGLSRDELSTEIVEQASPTVSDEEVWQFYMDRREQFGHQPFDFVKQRIKDFLLHQKSTVLIQSYVEDLKKKYPFNVFIPRSFQFDLQDNPTQMVQVGNADAKLTIDIFSDFECAHCKETHKQLERLYHDYPNDIRIHFRQFPLENHPGAHLKALAALCADQQGQYLAYSEKLYASLRPLVESQLIDYAKEIELDIAAFKTCLKAEETERILQDDIAEGERLSLSSTPSLFFNGEYYLRFPDETGLNQLLEEVEIVK